MEDFSLIPFDEGTDILPQEPSIREPIRPPSLPMESEPAIVEAIAVPERVAPQEPSDFLNNLLSKVLAPFVVLLTAIVVYRLFF